MTLAEFDTRRKTVDTDRGPVSYLDSGTGRVAFFIHGVGTSGYLWRNVIRQLEGERRCVALDLPLHGHTPAAPDQDFTLGALADVVAATCDALGLSKVDVVANDTGGAVAQIFAARHPDRLSSLTLTNCETHDNVPPKAFLPAVLLARAGLLARIARPLARNVSRARKLLYGSGYQNVRSLPEEVVASYVEPLLGTHDRALLSSAGSLPPSTRSARGRVGPCGTQGAHTRRVGHRGRVLPDEVGLLAARPHPGGAGSRGDPGWQVVLPRRAVARTGRRIAQILGSPFLSRAQRSGSKCCITPGTSRPVIESASKLAGERPQRDAPHAVAAATNTRGDLVAPIERKSVGGAGPRPDPLLLCGPPSRCR